MTALYNIYIYIYRFIISFGRNFLVCLSTTLSPYAFKRARVYQVTASIFIACLLHVASRPHLFRSLSDVDGAAAVGGARRGVRCGGGRLSPCHPDTWRMQRVYGCVCLRHKKCECSLAQQSMASVPTCSYSKHSRRCAGIPFLSLFGRQSIWTVYRVSVFFHKSCRFLCGRCRHVDIRDVIPSILSRA